MVRIDTINLPAGTQVTYVKDGQKVVETLTSGVEAKLVNFTDDPQTSLVEWSAAPGGQAFATEPLV